MQTRNCRVAAFWQRWVAACLLGLYVITQSPLLPAVMLTAARLDGEHRVELTTVGHHFRLTLRHKAACRLQHHHTALVAWFANSDDGPTHPDHSVEFAPVSSVSLEDAVAGELSKMAVPLAVVQAAPRYTPHDMHRADMIRVQCPYLRVPPDIERQRTVVLLV